jgi:lipopolysaccharide export LptBFGC system permease protein LptF
MFSVGISVVAAFLYWVAFSASLSFGKHGGVPPIIAAWAPNVIMSSAAIYLLLRQGK